MYAGQFTAGTKLEQKLTGNHGWIQVANGDVTVNGQALHAGDGVAINDEASVQVAAVSDAEILVFDLG